MHKCYIVDTNIFEYAYIVPKDPVYSEIHRKASAFLLPLLQNPQVKIAMSSYQVGEILKVLRKVGTRQEIRRHFVLPRIRISF